MPEPLILIADDEPEVLIFLRDALSSEPWAVELARDGREALRKLTEKTFDLAVLDLKMPFLDGVEVLKSLRDRGISTDVLILTGHGTVPMAVLAMKLGARDFITKPFKFDEFKQVIRNLLERRQGTAQTLPERLDAYLQLNAFNPDLHSLRDFLTLYLQAVSRQLRGVLSKKARVLPGGAIEGIA